MTNEKSPNWVRIADIILGVIAIALSAVVLANPGLTTVLYVTFLGIALILIGISRIIVGAIAKQVSKGSRGISIGIGILSIIGGAFAVANPITAVVTLITIIAIFVLIHGLGLIASGIASRGLEKGSRVGHIVLGVIAVAFASIIHAYPGLALTMMLLLLSLALLFNGIGSIVSGITGNSRISPITK